MRKLVVSVLTSLDGFYEGKGKDLSVMPFEDAFNTHNLQLLRQADTLVYGSTWFEVNWRAWTAVAADALADDRDREIASIVTTIDALVISDSLTIDPDAPWAENTRVVPRSEGPAEVDRLKRRDGGNLLMFGSSTTWNPLFEAGLVDELIVLVGPALIGDGSAIYSGLPATLRLIEAQVLPGSQLVSLRYDASPSRS